MSILTSPGQKTAKWISAQSLAVNRPSSAHHQAITSKSKFLRKDQYTNDYSSHNHFQKPVIKPFIKTTTANPIKTTLRLKSQKHCGVGLEIIWLKSVYVIKGYNPKLHAACDRNTFVEDFKLLTSHSDAQKKIAKDCWKKAILKFFWMRTELESVPK